MIIILMIIKLTITITTNQSNSRAPAEGGRTFRENPYKTIRT